MLSGGARSCCARALPLPKLPPLFAEANETLVKGRSFDRGADVAATARLAALQRRASPRSVQRIALPTDLMGTERFAVRYTEARGFALAPADRGARAEGRWARGTVPLHVVRRGLDYIAPGAYAWHGAIVYEKNGTEHEVGEATFVVNEGKITGKLVVDNESYEVRPLGGKVHALIDLNEEKVTAAPEEALDVHTAPIAAPTPRDTPIEAPVLHAPESMPVLDGFSVNSTAGGSCAPDPVDVLVVYTADAAQATGDIMGQIYLAVQQSNQAYANSQIGSVTMRLAHAQQVALVEQGGYDGQDKILNDLVHVANSHDVFLIRNQHEADVIVYLTNNDYEGEAKGVALSSPYNELDPRYAYSVVDVEYTASEYVFTHEVGHLQGATHHPDDPGTYNKYFSYGYGHRFSDIDCTFIFCDRDFYATIMAYTPRDEDTFWGDYRRRAYFSNPDVTYDSQPTGTPSRNNARVLNTTSLTVANHRGGSQPSASITKSARYAAPPAERYRFTANVCSGTPGYSYEWRIIPGGGGQNGFVASTSPSFEYTFSPDEYFVVLTVTDAAGQTTTASTDVIVEDPNGGGGGGDDPCPKPSLCGFIQTDTPAQTDAALEATQTEGIPMTFALHEPYPNPVMSSTTVRFDLPEATTVRVALYDLLGREVARVADGILGAGEHEATLDAAGLPGGTYVLRLEAEAFSATQSLTLVR